MSRKIDSRQRRQAKARQRRIAYAAIAGGAILILALVVLAVVGGNKPAEPLTGDTITMGARVYEQSCAACHGAQGEGHAAVAEAPALDETEHAWHHPDGQIQQLILNGGQLMPALGEQLSAEEVVAVIRYFQTWWTPDQLAQQQARSRQFPLTE